MLELVIELELDARVEHELAVVVAAAAAQLVFQRLVYLFHARVHVRLAKR